MPSMNVSKSTLLPSSSTLQPIIIHPPSSNTKGVSPSPYVSSSRTKPTSCPKTKRMHPVIKPSSTTVVTSSSGSSNITMIRRQKPSLRSSSFSSGIRYREYASAKKAPSELMSTLSTREDLETDEQPELGGLVGLSNLGNTCFMNSCLQCLSHVPELRQYVHSKAFAEDLAKSSKSRPLARGYGDLIQKLWHTTRAYGVTAPKEIKHVIGRRASRFVGFDQQDAQEFLRFLIDGLHEELGRVTHKPAYYEIQDRPHASDASVSEEYWRFYFDRSASRLSDLFCGQLKSEVVCQVCKNSSRCFDVFWDLSLPIPETSKAKPQVSIESCLEAYTEEEVMNAPDAFYCNKCQTHRPVKKTIRLFRSPEILVLHLKRFSFSSVRRNKITSTIAFPETGLNLRPYFAPDAEMEDEDPGVVYELTGMVNHMGSLNGGHYTADCRHAKNKVWYNFNDAKVSQIDHPRFDSSSAYILFYRRSTAQSSNRSRSNNSPSSSPNVHRKTKVR